MKNFTEWGRNPHTLVLAAFAATITIAFAASWLSLRDAQIVNYHLVDQLTGALNEKEYQKALYLEAKDSLDNCRHDLAQTRQHLSDCFDNINWDQPPPSEPGAFEGDELPRCDELPMVAPGPIPI